jgi:hypothetical protein
MSPAGERVCCCVFPRTTTDNHLPDGGLLFFEPCLSGSSPFPIDPTTCSGYPFRKSNAKRASHAVVRRLPVDERAFRQWFSLFGGEILVNLVIYADESGTHGGKTGSQPQSEVATVAGYAGKVDSWVKLRRDWKAILDKNHVDYFHYSPLRYAIKVAGLGRIVSQKGNPYRGWSKSQSEDFLLDCARVAAAGNRLPVGVDFDTRGYSQSMIPERLRMANPPAGAVWMFYETALRQIKKQWPMARGPIAFCFDRTDNREWLMEAQLIHCEFEHAYAKKLPRIGGISFEDKKQPENYGLQAADLYAGRLRELARLMLKYDPEQDMPLTELDSVLFGKFRVKSMRDVLSRRSSIKLDRPTA